MEKIAFKMKLKPGMSAEYKRRHDAIWPELITLLRENGVSDYSIFLDEETDTLFAVQYLAGHSSQELGREAIVQKWWDYMYDIMEVHADHSPVSVDLKKVFHMD